MKKCFKKQTPVLQVVIQVQDISSTINTQSYQPVNTYSNEKPLTIGWSGSHSTLKYFFLLKDVLIELRKKYVFNILIFGVTECEMPGLDVEVVPFSEVAEVTTLQRIDIGVYPLPLNEQWVYGKSGLKALQYMALGIPTVATSIAANLRIIEDRKTGLLVTTQEEWFNQLEMLLLHPVLRQEIGTRSRKEVVAKYSVEANKGTYKMIIESIL